MLKVQSCFEVPQPDLWGSDQSLPQICPHHQTCQASNMPSQQYAKPATCQVSKAQFNKAQVNKAQVPSQHCDHSRQVGSQSEPQSSHHSNTSNRVLRTYKQTISKWMISKCQAIQKQQWSSSTAFSAIWQNTRSLFANSVNMALCQTKWHAI